MINLPYFGKLQYHSGAPGVLKSDWSWRFKAKKDWHGLLIWAVTKGAGKVFSGNDEVTTVARGDVLIMRLDHELRGEQDSRRNLVVPWTIFDFDDPDIQKVWAQHAPAVMLRHSRDIDFVAGCLGRANDAATMGQPLGAEIYLQTAIAEFAAAPRQNKNADGVWMNRILNVCHRMQNNPERPWSVAELANEYNCAPDHFSRMFKQHIGEAPSVYAIKCRIDRARHMLVETNLSISELAEYLGYSDPYFFSKQFKSITGVSPRKFRETPPGGVSSWRK